MSESPGIAKGTVIGGAHRSYTLDAKVGEGGFGEVWRATVSDPWAEALVAGKPHGPRIVAIKFATSELGVRALHAELEVVGRLNDSRFRGVVHVVELVEAEPPCLVLEWIEGPTLRRLIDLSASDRPFTREQANGCVVELVKTIGRIHSAGVIHGDLKPENVLIGTDDGDRSGLVPHVIDFGLAHVARARRLDAKLSASLGSQSGLEGGTLAYLPPEAVKGAEPSLVGDVYALGVMLHEVLLGRRPDKARELSSLGLPDEVTEVLRRALAFDPVDRYPSASELSTALEKVRPALTATGSARRLLVLGRWLRAGLAAFFVALRYVSVAALVGLYLFIAVSAVTFHPVVLLGYVPFVLLHIAIRWEGPETREEAALRQGGNVLSRNLFAKPGKKR